MILFAKGEVGKAGLLDGLVADDQLAEPFLPGPFHVDHEHIARWSTQNTLYHREENGCIFFDRLYSG